MPTIRSLLNKSASPSPSLSSASASTTTTAPPNSATATATPSPFPTAAPRLLSPFSPAKTNHRHPLPLPVHHTRPKPKIIKDAPVFIPGPTRGPVRFPPHVYPVVDEDSSSSSEDEDEDEDEDGDTDAKTEAGTEDNSSTAATTSDHKPVNHDAITTLTTASTSPQVLETYHAKFSLYPSQASIGSYPRHIPYNSEKRVFLDKTGRDFFEVFQYTFQIPCGSSSTGRMEDSVEIEGTERIGSQKSAKTWTILWDYNTGLVRTTPLFKCCGYGKTTPAKMLNKNVGLRDICHSITGGALVAQGYWIPHLAAKHIAATFCYSIRYALTPVFGLDFIDLCVPPSDPRFGSMFIDEQVTVQCRQEADMYKLYEAEFPGVRPVGGAGGTGTGSRAGSPARSTRVVATPQVAMQSAYLGGKKAAMPVSLRFKAVNEKHGRGAEGAESGSDSDASTGSDVEVNIDTSEAEDVYLISPADTMSPSSPRFRDVWAAGRAAARSGGAASGTFLRSHPRLDDDLPSPKSGGKGFGYGHGHTKSKRNFADFKEGWMMGAAAAAAAATVATAGFGHGGSAYSTPMQSPKMRKLMPVQEDLGLKDVDVEMEDGYEAEGEEMEVDIRRGSGEIADARRYHGDAAAATGARGGKKFGDKEAAKALLSLWSVKKNIVRRASA